MTDNKEQGTIPDEAYVDSAQTEKNLMKSIDMLAQFGFTDNMSYNREILRRDTYSVTIPKLNVLVNTEYDLHKVLGMHVMYVQKALGLNPVYWTLQDALWLLRKLPKPIRTQYVQPPLPMSSDANIDTQQIDVASHQIGASSSDASKVPNSRLV